MRDLGKKSGNMALIDRLIYSGYSNYGNNSAMHYFSSKVVNGSSSQNLHTDLLMILSTVAISTVCSSWVPLKSATY